MVASMAASGTSLDECLCSHGEENAIVQASYHGVSLKDAIIYTTFAPCLMCAISSADFTIRRRMQAGATSTSVTPG